MRIAIISPIEETIPPKKYGGIEWVVYNVARGLGMKGHQVDLYASGDSNQDEPYTLIPVADAALRALPEFRNNLKKRNVEKLRALEITTKQLVSGTYDIIHNHASWRFLLFAPMISTPVVTTLHGPLNDPEENKVFVDNKNRFYISISNNQRKDLPQLTFAATIYNGVNVKDFPFIDGSDTTRHDYMIFLARMSHEKGAIDAAKAAIQSKQRLLLHSKVDKVDEPYFTEFNKVNDRHYVRFEGEIGMEEKARDLGNARCLLVPIKWEEPFGLMFTEAMACGTPVITYARGSSPEIIVDGETGFLVNESEEDKRGDWVVKKTGIDGLCEAINRVYALSPMEYQMMRRQSREHIEKHFTAEQMVNEYEKTFATIIAQYAVNQ